MDLKSAVNGFILARSAIGISPYTITIYKWGLDPFIRHLNNPDVKTIKREDIQKYLLQLQENRKLSGPSIQMVLRTIHAFYTWGVDELELVRPDKGIVLVHTNGKVIQPFTHEDIQAILKGLEYTRLSAGVHKSFRMKRPTYLRDYAMVTTLLDTGLRAGELCRLKIKDVNFTNGEVEVIPYLSGIKSRSRAVYLGKSSRYALWKYLSGRKSQAPDDPLFITAKGKPFNTPLLNHLVGRMGKRAGIKNAHPHRFRHTFAIQYLRNGGDIFTLQRLLGHSSLLMVRNYLALADTDSMTAHARASPVDRWGL